MAVEVEDDDVFFADLSKQMALLIMDDEEDFPVQCPAPLQVQELPYMPQIMMLPPYIYINEVGYRRESKGTGVFIPRSTVVPRRKTKSRNSNSVDKNNSSNPQRHLHKSAAVVSHVTK